MDLRPEQQLRPLVDYFYKRRHISGGAVLGNI